MHFCWPFLLHYIIIIVFLPIQSTDIFQMKESRHFNQNITPGSLTEKNQGVANKTNISSLKAILNQGRVPLSQYINEKAARLQSHHQNLSYFDKLKVMFNKGNEAKTVRQTQGKGKAQEMDLEYENKAIDQSTKQENFSIGNTNQLRKINYNKGKLESQARFKERSRSMHGKSRQKGDNIQRLETVSNNKKMVEESLQKTFDKAYTQAESQSPSTKNFIPALVPRFKALKKQIINYSKFTPIYTRGKEETGILQLDETLGCGANATVRIGKEKRTQRLYAVKIYEKYKLIQPIKKKRVFREIEILSSICHKNIIQINNCYEDKRQIHILFEFIPNARTLQDFLRGNCHEVELAHKNHIALKITQAISYLHAHGISHRDIKTDNVMIGDEGVVKLIDFGFATTVTKGETHCGTPNYMAPQLFCKKSIYNPYKVDIWALGILLYYLYQGCYPFRGYNEKELSRYISNGVFGFKKCGIEMREIINSVLIVDPAQRLTADQLQQELRNVSNL